MKPPAADPPAAESDPRARVLAWIAETGRGYKAAAREFGVPRSTIQSWVLAERAAAARPAGDRATSTSRARTRTRATPAAAPTARPPAPEPEEEWDPTTCSREDWLRRGMVRAMERGRLEILAKHGGTAARWEAIAGKYRNELDQLLEEQRLKGLTPAPVDLVTLSRELAAMIPALVRLDPERWAGIVDLLQVEVAKYRGSR